jgi:hypothetical protein
MSDYGRFAAGGRITENMQLKNVISKNRVRDVFPCLSVQKLGFSSLN